MAVRRFYDSLEEMNAAPIRTEAKNAFERFVRHCNRYRLISQRKNPRGVFKFRSIEEAQAARAFSEQLLNI